MGFFSDLKQDISQAVNELITDELPAEEKEISLEEMLQNIDDIKLPEDVSTEKTSDVLEYVDVKEEAPDEKDVNELESMIEEIEKMDAQDLEQLAELAESGIPQENAGEAQTDEEVEEVSELERQLREAFGENKEEANSEVVNAEEKSADTERWTKMSDNMDLSGEMSVVSANMKITGDILSEGSLTILGYVKGGVEVLEKLNVSGVIEGDSVAAEVYTEQARIQGNVTSQGSVKIGVGSVVIGNIVANSAAIAGAVKGDIDVHGPVILDSTAIVMGNIKSEAVQINSGAVIEGMCSQCYANVNPTAFFDELDVK